MLSPQIIAIGAAVVFTVVLTMSIAALWTGLRGRLIDMHARCRRCGYDLTGHACRPERCAECGSRLLVVGAVKLGHRKLRPAFLGVGGLTFVIAVLGLAAMATLADTPPAAAPAKPGIVGIVGIVAVAGARQRQAAPWTAQPVSAPSSRSDAAPFIAASAAPVHSTAARRQDSVDEQVGSGIDVLAAMYFDTDAPGGESEPSQHLRDVLDSLRELGGLGGSAGSAVSLNSFDPAPFTPIFDTAASVSWSMPSSGSAGGGSGGPARLKVTGSNPLGGPIAAPGLLNVSDPMSTARRAERVNEAICTRIKVDGAPSCRNGPGKSRRGRGAPKSRSGLRK